MGYVEFIIKRLREKKCYDVLRYAFYSSGEIKPSDSCFHFSSATALIAPAHINNLGMWIHEFTEMTIIQILNRWKVPWRKEVKFDGFKSTRVVHFISLWGLDNGRCLFPQVSKREPKW